MKKTVVTFVASTFTVGGSERVLSHVISRLPADRFRVNLYFLREAGRVGRELFDAGIGGAEAGACFWAGDGRERGELTGGPSL